MKKILLSLSIIGSILSQAQVVTSLAGSGTQGTVNATGPAASFNSPTGTCSDAAGNIYVADQANQIIRKITPAGVVSTIAGMAGVQGTVDATGTAASFNNPYGICIDATGNLFVTDQDNQTIRKITPSGVVSTFAGQVGMPGSANGTGTAASFNYPRGICIDGAGNMYVTDYLGHLIRKVTAAGVVTTFAGSGLSGSVDATGTAASFNRPSGVCLDPTGNLFVADRSNHKVRRITPGGVVTTFAGSGAIGSANATGTLATFNLPFGVVSDAAGMIYVADFNNQRIRKITQAQVVTYFAGSGVVGAVDATGTSASFNGPIGLCTDMSGNLYVADQFNHKIRKITNPAAGIVEIPSPAQSMVYPNPSSDLFFVELKAAAKVTVTNSLGQIIFEQTMNAGKQSINLQNHAKGIYFVSVLQNEKSQTIKLVKE